MDMTVGGNSRRNVSDNGSRTNCGGSHNDMAAVVGSVVYVSGGSVATLAVATTDAMVVAATVLASAMVIIAISSSKSNIILW